MRFEDYEREAWSRYAAFGETVADILRAAIRTAGGYRLQQVRSRAKDATSLRKKLEERGKERGIDLVGAEGLEAEIKDLAGCRIVFYTNGDVSKLINSGLIAENFKILEVKLHHPRRETEDAAELYISNHYLVRLSDDRLKLPEYGAFVGMRCEVQVQTILNHAWAEMAHDTIYKEPELDAFGTRALDAIKTRMARIARRYLVPAGYEFGKVAADFERLMRGEDLFKGEALQAIVDAADNNQRMEALDTFAENVLPLYDDVKPEFPDILAALREAAERARKAEPRPISTPYGQLRAKTPTDVLRGVSKIIGDYRYVDPEAALDTLLQLYVGAGTDDERKPIADAAKRLAGHELQVWRLAGPAIQTMAVDMIGRMRDDQRRAALPLVATVLETVLGTEVSGSTATSGTVTLHRGAVRASPELTAMRRQAMAVLKSLYGMAPDDDARRTVLSALDAGTRPPMGSGYGADLVVDLVESVAELIEFEGSVVGDMSWELRQTQERRVLRHAQTIRNLPADLAGLPAVADLQVRIADAVAAFRVTVDADAEYAIYKVLVGFDVVYPPSWDRDRFDHRAEQAYRDEEVERLVANISADNAAAWHGRVKRCAETRSQDLATFPTFSRFLQRAGETKPGIVLGWLDEIERPLARFIPPMLLGLRRSAMAADAAELVRRWTAAGLWLAEIAWTERSTESIDEGVLEAVVAQAALIDDREAVRTAMSVAGIRFREHPGTLVTSVFMPGLRHMAAHGDTSWLGRGLSTWYHAELVEALDEAQVRETLAAMVRVPEIADGASHVAAAIAKRWHALVLDFLGERERIAACADRPEGFTAIPHSVEDELRTSLSAHPGDLLATARRWFDDNPDGFEWGGGRLVARIFPELAEPLAGRLHAIVAEGGRDEAAFAVAILNGYEGSERIDAIARAAIAKVEPGDEVLTDVARALEQSGVIMGEFGFVERLERQLVRVRTWLEDGDARVRAFAEEHVRYLDRAIAAETRRAESSRAARRLEWGEDIAEEPPAGDPPGRPA